MMDNRFEQAFGEYLDSTECDEIEDTLFAAIRNAFFGRVESGRGQPAPACTYF